MPRFRIPTWLVIVGLILAIWAVVSCGCKSRTAAISQAAREVRQEATASTELAGAILELARGNPAGAMVKIAQNAEAIIASQSRILAKTDLIQEQIPHVRDVTPWWASTIAKVAAAVIALVVLVLLWQAGILPLIRACIVGLVALIPKASILIPRKTREAAKLSLEATDAPTLEKVSVAVATRRTADPLFDAAMKSQKRGKHV